MKKIILVSLLVISQNLIAGDCTLQESKEVAVSFLENEVTCSKREKGQYGRTTSCEIKGKEFISREDFKAAGIRLFRAQKYILNSVSIEDYKIVNINNKETYVELYNYSHNWYKTANIRFVKEDGKCYLDTEKIKRDKTLKEKEVFYIHMYFNMKHNKI